MDLQKHLSGVNSPAIASPSCEIKSEYFPPLPASIQANSQQQPQSSTPAETPKVTPKISELSVLEEQLSKIHQKPFTQPAQQSPHPSYSEAVRQSPTTVQQQFPTQAVAPQVQIATQQAPVVAINANPSPVVTPATQNQSANTQKVSRFQVSKVEEQKSTVPSQQQPKALPSPDVEVQNVQNIPQVSPQPIQPSQAQAFFQQHQGGVVSRIF